MAGVCDLSGSGVVEGHAALAAPVEGGAVLGESGTVGSSQSPPGLQGDAVRVSLEIHRGEDLPAHGVRGLLAVVEVQEEPADACVAQAPGHDLERRLLLGDEENLAAFRDSTDDDVGDRLGLAGAGWALDDDRAPAESLGDHLGLRGVGRHREPGQELLEANHRGMRLWVGELLVGRLDEVADEGVSGDLLP